MHYSPNSSLFSHSGAHLRVDGVSFAFGAHRVLTNISFSVPAGDRVGLIGENGSGKSTLLKIIAGTLTPASGTVSAHRAGSESPLIGLLQQEPPFAPSDSISDALEMAVQRARRAVADVGDLGEALAEDPENPQIATAYAEALEAVENSGAWDLDSQISEVLSGLGLGHINRQRLTGSLSGGERARLALGWLLLNSPDVLLLDEPTNHLDDAATKYLIEVLNAWRGPVVIASHDRAFLDEAVTSLLDLDPAPVPHGLTANLVQDGPGSGIGVTRFTGTYSDYLLEQATTRQRWEQRYRDEQAELARLRSAVKTQQTVGHADWRPRTEARIAQKFYADRNAKVVSRRVNDARGRLHELEEQQIRKPPAELRFRGLTAADLPCTSDPQGPIVSAVNVAVAGRLSATTLSIGNGEKWLITGPNGAGKSTLLNVLAGKMAPTSGTVNRFRGARVGILTQEIELPDPHGRGAQRTVLETYRDLVGARRSEEISLATFGLIAGRDHNRPLHTLSVGQRRRLALAVLLADPPEILLLDEPTNHFSLRLVTSLEAALAAYPGTVVLASHDRWLRRRWAGAQLTIG